MFHYGKNRLGSIESPRWLLTTGSPPMLPCCPLFLPKFATDSGHSGPLAISPCDAIIRSIGVNITRIQITWFGNSTVLETAISHWLSCTCHHKGTQVLRTQMARIEAKKCPDPTQRRHLPRHWHRIGALQTTWQNSKNVKKKNVVETFNRQ